MLRHERRKVYVSNKHVQRGKGQAAASIGANIASSAFKSTASVALPIIAWELAMKPLYRYGKKRLKKAIQQKVASSTGLTKAKNVFSKPINKMSKPFKARKKKKRIKALQKELDSLNDPSQ